MQIRIKPKVIVSGCGFDIIGRPDGPNRVHSALASLKTGRWHERNDGMYVYWKEKRKYRKVEQEVIPTHWLYKIWFIPSDVLELIARDNKVVKQHKNHWSIESKYAKYE